MALTAPSSSEKADNFAAFLIKAREILHSDKSKEAKSGALKALMIIHKIDVSSSNAQIDAEIQNIINPPPTFFESAQPMAKTLFLLGLAYLFPYNPLIQIGVAYFSPNNPIINLGMAYFSPHQAISRIGLQTVLAEVMSFKPIIEKALIKQLVSPSQSPEVQERKTKIAKGLTAWLSFGEFFLLYKCVNSLIITPAQTSYHLLQREHGEIARLITPGYMLFSKGIPYLSEGMKKVKQAASSIGSALSTFAEATKEFSDVLHGQGDYYDECEESLSRPSGSSS